MTFEEYKDYYEQNGQTINGLIEIKQGLKYQYTKWIKKQNKINAWRECREEAYRRNPNAEQFFDRLTKAEYDYYDNLYGKFATLDPCHIIGKGECSINSLSNNPDNILIAPREFHTYIDTYHNPFTREHELITKEERDQIWIRFIGEEMWNKLQEIKKG
ncbi:MAG: hypothetical protein PF569_03845 [Candidatus Woesearchaeota archaeon]|jgi:hypothetical protein|nr:hypothetical protein [Candidatus Woesearchaeota archaeon]